MTGKTRKYRTIKLKTFLLFLLLALLIWVLTKFSKESTATINTNLVFTNLPSTVSISPNTPKDLDFNISANGFQFLSYKLNVPTIDIDISKFYEQGDTLILISNSELNKIINSQLDNYIQVSQISLDELWVDLDPIVTKNVAIQFISEIQYKEGYKSLGNVTLRPDSVGVSGPSEVLDSIRSIITETFVKKNVSETINGTLVLQNPKNSILVLSNETTEIQLIVEEFTQKRLSIPIEITNVPGDIELKIIPESIDVSFEVSLSKFNSISEEDFRIVCDYATRSLEENFMIPKLLTKPDGLHNIELQTKKIEYLIFK
jgi:YbbR-like protein